MSKLEAEVLCVVLQTGSTRIPDEDVVICTTGKEGRLNGPFWQPVTLLWTIFHQRFKL